MKALKLILAVAVLAISACEATSPVSLPQDRGLEQANTCDPDIAPC
jgi:hypothetical protein